MPAFRLFRALRSRRRPALLLVLLVASTPALISWVYHLFNEHAVADQKTLRSRITSDTPVAGFYGPGSWWAFLVTLGMSHGHALTAIWKTGSLPSSEWDYDFVGASAYIVAAAIDLIIKSRTIARLGDQASQSSLLPVLVCAERVVSLGTGSSVFSLGVALRHGPHWRTVLVASIPLVLALIASGFCLHAHKTISRAAPVIWCLHQGGLFDSKTPFLAAPDFPAVAAQLMISILKIYSQEPGHNYWRGWVWWTPGGTFVFLVFWLVQVGLREIISAGILAVGFLGMLFVLFPIIFSIILLSYITLVWLVSWVLVWWPVFFLAFFPLARFFPPTNISPLEMDQLAAPLAIVAVAAIRTSRTIYRAFYPTTIVTDLLLSEDANLAPAVLPPFDFELSSNSLDLEQGRSRMENPV
ncbi:hypothetical protein R3P38DRAFT_2649515 [Favolaschia claudopus]|uniref:Uncharacterized protein n=1 Tax=Favolaschia claudopus TaxID=2862362 RepID=A0AAW0A594_9AGAR